MNPTQIGPYQITGVLGSGGMSIVYRAVQPSLNRVVALKVLAPNLEHDQTAVERFRQEAQAAARLKQPNIVTVYEANTTSPPYYIAMEFLEGGTLADRLGGGPLRTEHALAILRQICAGLDHAHRHHVVHRDIKPANIMFDSEGKVAVTDFGISRVLDRANLTMVGTRTGTAEYMSPEQARGEEVDFRSDLYSLGVVAYEMLTGRVPFSAPQPLVTMRQIVDETVPSPRSFNSSIPQAAETVLLKALEKDPRKRYPSGAEFFRSLWAAYTGKRDPAPRRILALAASLLVIVGLAALLIKEMLPPTTVVVPPPKVEAPNLVGLSEREANDACVASALRMYVSQQVYDADHPLGTVCGQDPIAGASVTQGSEVRVHLSLGKRPEPAPAETTKPPSSAPKPAATMRSNARSSRSRRNARPQQRPRPPSPKPKPKEEQSQGRARESELIVGEPR